MKLWLLVRQPGESDVLYFYEYPDLNVAMPSGTNVTMAFTGPDDDDETGFSLEVHHSYFDMKSGTFEVQLQKVIIDPVPAESFRGSSYQTAWWTDRDGPAEQLHASLKRGGWKVY